MSNDIADDVLAHYGVKGMKWGVIREQASSGNRRAQKTLQKADRKWQKELHSTAGFIKVNNAIADKMNGPNGLIAKHNSDSRWSGKDLNDPKNSKIADQYYNTFAEVQRKTFESTVKELYGESPSGKYTVSVDRDSGAVNVQSVDEIKHDVDGDILVFKFSKNKLGMFESLEEDVLAHYGVKGMKWGVIRSLKGRERGPDSEDHVKSRTLMKKPRRELSTKELKELNNRLQLEKTNNELQSRTGLQKIKTGTAIAGSILAVGATVTTAYNFINSPAGKAITNALKTKA